MKPRGLLFLQNSRRLSLHHPNVCKCSEYQTLTSLPEEAAGKSLLIKGHHMVAVCERISGLRELKWELSLLLAFLNGLRLLLNVALLKAREEFRSVFKQWKIQGTNFHSLLSEALNRRSFSPDLLLQNYLFFLVRRWCNFSGLIGEAEVTWKWSPATGLYWSSKGVLCCQLPCRFLQYLMSVLMSPCLYQLLVLNFSFEVLRIKNYQMCILI